MRANSTWLSLFAVITILAILAPLPAMGKSRCQINVSTILAAKDDTTIDPKLKPRIAELQSMFSYTSYRLLGSESLLLDEGQSGIVSLPGGHQLKITPHKIRGSRADIALQMMKQEHSVFQTQIQLLNRGRLFVGGPKYLNGNLIFEISSSY